MQAFFGQENVQSVEFGVTWFRKIEEKNKEREREIVCGTIDLQQKKNFKIAFVSLMCVCILIEFDQKKNYNKKIFVNKLNNRKVKEE